jgi:uncharacterized protein (TIGR02594 family)
MVLPKKYSFLNDIGVLPQIVAATLQYLGVKEYPTKSKNNPVIMGMAKTLDVDDIYVNDEISWCALFMCFIMWLCKKPMKFLKYDILRAASFKSWGNEVERGDERLGDVCVFSRPGGNHVAILIAVTKVNGKITTVHVLGGNQSNAVTFSEIAYERMTHCRRFYATAAPASAKQYVIGTNGVLSTNEA